jgi:hypothetical protein
MRSVRDKGAADRMFPWVINILRDGVPEEHRVYEVGDIV